MSIVLYKSKLEEKRKYFADIMATPEKTQLKQNKILSVFDSTIPIYIQNKCAIILAVRW